VLNYIEVPILAKYSIPVEKLFNVFFDAGPNFGFSLALKPKPVLKPGLYGQGRNAA